MLGDILIGVGFFVGIGGLIAASVYGGLEAKRASADSWIRYQCQVVYPDTSSQDYKKCYLDKTNYYWSDVTVKINEKR